MYCDKSLIIFGFCEFAIEMLNSVCAKAITVCDIDETRLIKASSMGYNTKLLDIDNDEALENIIHKKDFLFVLSDDEALNAFVVITARTLSSSINIITLGVEDDKHKLLLAGANRVIDPYYITANKIFDILQKPLIVDLLDETIFSNADLNVAQLEIKHGCIFDGLYLDDCDFRKYNLLVTGIIDAQISDSFLFATGQHKHILNDGDIIVVIGKEQDILNLKQDLGLI